MSEVEYTETTGVPRDRWGRPMVLLPGSTTKRVGYQRTTTFVGVLENTYNLMAWKQRQTVLGMGARKDLVLAAAAADPGDKKTLNDIAEKACEHALSSAPATTGTALHSLTERIDRGKPLGVIPDSYKGDIAAYEKATAAIEFTGIETFRVCDDWKVAGTADRIGRYRGRLMVMDIKTGSIDYPHKMAMQLAMYARSLPYDVNTDTRGNTETGLDLNHGIIIHLPAEQARCDLYLIDIMKGWGACRLAKQVWDWRDTKNLTEIINDEYKGTAFQPTFIDLATQAKTLDELRELWRRAKQSCAATPDFLAACEERKHQLANN